MHGTAVIGNNQAATTHSRSQATNSKATSGYHRRGLHEANSLLHHILIHGATEENGLIAFRSEGIGNLGKALGGPALGHHSATNIKADELIAAKDAMVTPKFLRMGHVLLTGENF